MTDRFTDNTGPEPGVPANFAFMTLEEEAAAGGWTRITRPVGGVVAPTTTLGTRGDNDMDNDESFGPGSRSTVSDET